MKNTKKKKEINNNLLGVVMNAIASVCCAIFSAKYFMQGNSNVGWCFALICIICIGFGIYTFVQYKNGEK